MIKRLAIVIYLLLSVQISQAQDNGMMSRARRYELLIIEAAMKHRVDPRLIWTVAYLETRFRHYDQEGRIITSSAGAKGVVQFMPRTAARYGWRDMDDPGQAIDAAARYLRDLQAMFADRLDQVLAAYNAGEGAVEAFRTGRRLVLSNGKVINPRAIKSSIPPYRETINYVTNGIQIFRELAAAGYLAGPRLPVIQMPEEQTITITVDLEELPEEVIDLKKGSVYVIEKESSSAAPMKKPASSSSIYAR